MMGLSIGLPARVAVSGGGASVDADAAILIAAMTTPPDATRAALINTTILALKAAGIWTLLDECWFMAAHDSQAGLLGWKRYKNLTAVNAPTFTTDRGFAGNGTTSYLNTNLVPSTDGVQYLLNDASFGVYSRTNGTTTAIDMAGRNSSTAAMAEISIRYTDNQSYPAINSANTYHNVGSLAALGLFAVRRSGSGSVQLYKNGSSIQTGTTTSTAKPAFAIYIGCANTGGTPSNFAARQYAFAFVGASMSAGQQADLATIVESYMDAIGAGVI